MSTFFDKLNKTSQDTVQKVKDSSEIIKINNLISVEEEKINDTYFHIGKAYFEQCKDYEVMEQPFSTLFSDIKLSIKNIEEYREEIEKIQNIKKCPNCGNKCSKDSVFCSECGTRIQEVVFKPTCPSCGSDIKEDDKFCYVCGNKLK